MEKFDVSIILPIKSSSHPWFEEYFQKAITSIVTQKVQPNELIIVHTDETNLVEYLNNYDYSGVNVNKVVWTKEPNFSEQVNHGVKIATSKWVTIFEFDDEYSKIWFDNVQKFSKHYPNVDCFLPIVVDVTETGQFAGFTNEATFAVNMSNEMGVLTNETLQNYQNFQISGMVIKKSTFIDFGLLKASFKLTFGYEMFLRLTHNGVKIMSIPRIGYKHTNLRQGSIFWNYKNGDDVLSKEEVKFWIDSAKSESFFIVDRAIKYEA
jgi:glycosyltransferase involved in cell wall biosynthesis